MATRFSKKALQEDLQSRIDSIQRTYGFDTNSGRAQIPYIAEDMKEPLHEVARAYGELEALIGVAESFDLPIYPLGNVLALPKLLRHGYKRFITVTQI